MRPYHLVQLSAVLSVLSVLIALGNCDCGKCIPHYPVFGQRYLVTYNELLMTAGSHVFPSEGNGGSELLFFNELNFDDSPNGTFFVGAKNTLYELNATNLDERKKFTWNPLDSDVAQCENGAHDPDVACENYIRLYKSLSFSGAEDRLLVCGTGAYNITCRTINKNDISDESSYGPSTPKLDMGIVSIHPYIPFAGDFLDDPTNGYQTTGYISKDLSAFDFARYDASYDEGTMEITFSAKPTRTIQTTNNFHIRAPYLPVKVIKQHFNSEDKYRMFYFFIRERKFYGGVSDAVPVRSRVIRVCEVDDGLNIQANNLFFKTYLKMEILCFGNPPDNPQAVGTQEHYYTVLRDVVQTDSNSRWNGNTNVWHKLAYGIFTGDVYGPNGTAICVYHVIFTTGIEQNDARGFVDVLNFNNFKDDQGNIQANENADDALLDCTKANARDDTDAADHLIAVRTIKPYFGLSLPLIEVEGEVFTKIVVQQVCVRRNNSNACLMQDVLFVGTNTGRVKKIAFSTIEDSPNAELNGITHDAIIAQEWELADGNSVEHLTLQDDHLYVGTYSRVYKFPVADCSRYSGCGQCVGARDPYCYWDTDTDKCTRNTVGTPDNNQEIALDASFIQNIHTGMDNMCGDEPQCRNNLTMTSTASDTIEVSGLEDCTYTDSFSISVEPFIGCDGETVTATISADNPMVTDSAILGRRLYKVVVTAMGANGNVDYTDFVQTLDGVPETPTDTEITAQGVNSTHVEVIVSLDGCSIHDELEDHRICVEFNNSQDIQCQDYNGVNSFISGPYLGSESVNYFVTVENNHGKSSGSAVAMVTTRASAPNSPEELFISNITSNFVALEWRAGADVFSAVTGYSILVNGVKRTDCSTINNNYTLYGLYGDTDYKFSVTACSAGGESDPADVNGTTSCDIPTEVRNLRATNADVDFITFSWNEPMYANGTDTKYQVLLQCYNRSSLMVEESEASIPTTEYTMENLQPLTRCCAGVSVVISCDDNRNYRSQAILVCEQTLDSVPGPVEDFTVTAANPNSLFVTWLAPLNYTNPSLRYEVKWVSADSIMESDMVMDQLYFFIDGLNQSTPYDVTITPISDVGSGAETSSTATTLADIPSRPHDVEIQFSGCQATVSWMHQDKDVYQVSNYYVKARCNEIAFSQTVPSSSMSYMFNDACDISSVTWCTAQVQAENTVGRGEFSSLANAAYSPSTPPAPLCYISQDLGNYVAISFTISAPYALNRLTVNYTLNPSPPGPSLANFSFTGHNLLNFSRLSRDSTYDFSLRLCEGIGCSESCDITFSPSQAPPAPPMNIEVSNVAANEFTLKWEPPANEDETLLKYTVHVTGQGNSWYFNTSDTSITVPSLLSDTVYYYVVKSVYTTSMLSGTFSQSKVVKTSPGSPPMPTIVNIDFLEGVTESSLKVSWNLPDSLNGTAMGFIITWSLTLQNEDDCEDKFEAGEYENITRPSDRFTEITTQTRRTSEVGDGTLCIRSANEFEMSSWTVMTFTITDLNPVTEQIVADNEAQDIGVLSVVIFLAIVAIVIAVLLTIILIYFMNRRPKQQDISSPVDVTDGSSLGEKESKDMPNGSNKKNTPKRMESTRSTRPMLDSDSNNSDRKGRCNIV